MLGVAVQLAGAGVHSSASAQVDARAMFERFADRVVQVRLVEAESGGQAGVGTGFYASPQGHIVTNFHVVAELIHRPGRYRAELVRDGHPDLVLELQSVDVAHDLAILRGSGATPDPLDLRSAAPPQGARLYAFGNPYDLGQSIVEGTYNGLLEHSADARIHFTGSLNPGMSGGPTLDASGRVVGVNVATAGNQVSFLVPARYVAGLLEAVSAPRFEPPPDFKLEIARQLLERQEHYVARLFEAPPETVELGAYVVPSRPAPFFSCWGDRDEDEDEGYVVQSHECSSDDGIYISRAQRSTLARLRHRRLSAGRLGPTRFYELYSVSFEANHSDLWGTSEDYTRFECEIGFVEHAGRILKTAFCVRRYLAFPGVYDAVFKAAVLGESGSGLETALVLSAVSFENAERLARRHLEQIAWMP